MRPDPNEDLRLNTLRSLSILDTEPEQFFEDVVDQVVDRLGVPTAIVSLVDEDRQWFKAKRGLTLCSTLRKISFCTVAIQTPTALVVNDAHDDPRFAESPLVTCAPHVRSYLGMPIEIDGVARVGAVAAIDTEARDWQPDQTAFMERMGRMVARYLEARTALLTAQRVNTALVTRKSPGGLRRAAS
jgi:GAF domain-containing protein